MLLDEVCHLLAVTAAITAREFLFPLAQAGFSVPIDGRFRETKVKRKRRTKAEMQAARDAEDHLDDGSEEADFTRPHTDPDTVEHLARRAIDSLRFWLTHRAKTIGSSWNASELASMKVAGPVAIDTGAKGLFRNGHVDLRSGLPRVAMMYMPRNESEHGSSGSASLFSLYALEELPATVAPLGPGIPYEVADLHQWKKRAGGVRYYVTIDREGKIHPCKWHGTTYHRLPNGNYLPRHGWQMEAPLSDGSIRSVLVAGATISAWKMAQAHWVARIGNGDVNVRIPIKDNSVKTLFTERTDANDEKPGTRRRATHWVRAHRREGYIEDSTVRTHLRGATQFTWRGMRVGIHVPGTYESELPRSIAMLDDPKLVQRQPEIVTSNRVMHSLFAAIGLKFQTRSEMNNAEWNDLRTPADPLKTLDLIPEGMTVTPRYYTVNDAVSKEMAATTTATAPAES